MDANELSLSGSKNAPKAAIMPAHIKSKRIGVQGAAGNRNLPKNSPQLRAFVAPHVKEAVQETRHPPSRIPKDLVMVNRFLNIGLALHILNFRG